MAHEAILELIAKGDDAAVVRSLRELHPADIAEVLAELPPERQAALIKELGAPLGAEALSELEADERAELLELIDARVLADLLETLPADEATDIVGEAPDEKAEDVLGHLEPEDSAEIKQLLEYEDDSASGIMDPELFSVHETTTVGQTLKALRELEFDEPVYYVYAVDYRMRLVGTLTLQKLIASDESRPVGSIMNRRFISVRPDTDQEEVAQLVQKYDLLAVPVVDEDDCLLGRITVDDVMDVLDEERTEDLMRLAGVTHWSEETRSMFKTALKRMPWLVVALIGSLVGAAFQRFFGARLGMESYALFAPFVTVIAAMGGNIGIQSCTTMVRGIAVGEIDENPGKAIIREIRISFIVGVACALIAALFAHITGAGSVWYVSSVVGVSLFVAIMGASTVGAMAPAMCNRVGIDPTAASGPLVTVTLDILGIAIYFSIAIAALYYLH